MQRNCHEFIAYENLVGSRGGRPAERSGRAVTGTSDIAKALPLVKRALKVLSDREVTPQLGLLKSTLLQLDSTFSEREYGVSSFRDFMEKVAQAGAVTLKHAGRSMLVEQVEDGLQPETTSPAESAGETTTLENPAKAGLHEDDEEQMPVSPMSLQDGIRAVQRAFRETPPARWPLYVRQAKQHLRSTIDGFDERKYGFASVVDLLRAAGKEGVLRIERDRQGAIRLFPGANLAPKQAMSVDEPEILDVEEEAYARPAEAEVVSEPVADPPIVDAEPILGDESAAEEPVAEPTSARKRKTPARVPKAAKTGRAAKPRARKSVAKSA
jgi:hypothetical protein